MTSPPSDRPTPPDERPHVPGFRTWTGIYLFVFGMLAGYIALLALLTPEFSVNTLDYLVLLGTVIGIAVFSVWRTRGQRNLNTYLIGSGNGRWLTIGLSVMATQASATTFLSTPGQGYQDGLGFVQNYFGAPLALVMIATVFLPIFRRLKVYTAYEYLGQRFDKKTRLLGASLFLLQRGIAAGITIYAPAIVLSTVMGWRLDVTIVASGLVVLIYTVAGGSEAVSLTQKYQFLVIVAGMITAFVVLLSKMPPGVGIGDAFTIAGGFEKLEAVNFSPSLAPRYTVWSGLFGGMFLAWSYFGADQSQVQRYLGGASLRESRLGLMFNAVFKIPMQLFILLLGAFIFVFYQFERPPVFFNQVAWAHAKEQGGGERLRRLEDDFAAVHAQKRELVSRWISARDAGDDAGAATAQTAAAAAHARGESIRAEGKRVLLEFDPRAPETDTDYVFITFILDHLPHGVIGLLITVFFAATLNSKAAELNALASATTVDFYRHLIQPHTSDARCVKASRWFTGAWGLIAIGFALTITLAENLIQYANIIASLFYPVILGLFIVAFFLKAVRGHAVFWAALATQVLMFCLHYWRTTDKTFPVSYLWDNLFGCATCVLLALILEGLARKLTPSRA